MEKQRAVLDWIDTQKQIMQDLVARWSNINTHTFNLSGLRLLSVELKKAFSVFGEEIKEESLLPYESINENGKLEKLPVAPALVICKRPEAAKQGLFVIHMDTVFTRDDPFQEAVFSDDMLTGPGVTDAKGGIAVLLKALEALERSPLSEEIGWKVVINTDEEIGSPCSSGLLKKLAKECHIGFVFEPSFPNGKLIGARKGSGNYTLVARGRSAHAGRNFDDGRNAINTLAKCIVSISSLNGSRPGLTVNFGTINGGSAVNIVPDLSVGRFNVRIEAFEDQSYLEDSIQTIIDKTAKEDEVELVLHGGFSAPPRPMDEKTLRLYKEMQSCGSELGMSLDIVGSGGVSDGNRISAVGLPTLDSLGVRGDRIHTDKEYLLLDSLTERAKLTALFLLKWADGRFEI